MLHIFVMPTQPEVPPRALLFEVPDDPVERNEALRAMAEDLQQKADAAEEMMEPMIMVPGTYATWVQDSGCWMVGGQPVQQELGDAITNRAAELGVPGFG
jgi:hypothetical protein